MAKSVGKTSGEPTKLSPAQAAEGAQAACLNAQELLKDAYLLMHAKRPARAIALSILAIEETAKPLILAEIAGAAGDSSERNRLWAELRMHTAKNALGAVLHAARNAGIQSPEQIGSDRLSEFSKVAPSDFDRLKQDCFYSRHLPDGKWREPREVAGDDLAEKIFSDADMALKAESQSPFLHEIGVRLYADIVYPHKRKESFPTAWREFRDKVTKAGIAKLWFQLIEGPAFG